MGIYERRKDSLEIRRDYVEKDKYNKELQLFQNYYHAEEYFYTLRYPIATHCQMMLTVNSTSHLPDLLLDAEFERMYEIQKAKGNHELAD